MRTYYTICFFFLVNSLFGQIEQAKTAPKDVKPKVFLEVEQVSKASIEQFEELKEKNTAVVSTKGRKFYMIDVEYEEIQKRPPSFLKIIRDENDIILIEESDHSEIDSLLIDRAEAQQELPATSTGVELPQNSIPSDSDTVPYEINLYLIGPDGKILKLDTVFSIISFVAIRDNEAFSIEFKEEELEQKSLQYIGSAQTGVPFEKTMHQADVTVHDPRMADLTEEMNQDFTQSSHPCEFKEIQKAFSMIPRPSVIAFNPNDNCVMNFLSNLDPVRYPFLDSVFFYTHANLNNDETHGGQLVFFTDLELVKSKAESAGEQDHVKMCRITLVPEINDRVLEIHDSISLDFKFGSGSIPIQFNVHVSSDQLKVDYLSRTNSICNNLVSDGEYIQAIDTLEYSRIEWIRVKEDPKPLDTLATSIMLLYAEARDPSSKEMHQFRMRWKGSDIQEYIKLEREKYYFEINRFTTKLPSQASAFINFYDNDGKWASKLYPLDPSQKGALAYSRFLVMKDSSPGQACEHLRQAQNSPFKYVDTNYSDYCESWNISKLMMSISIPYKKTPPDYQTVYKNGKANPSIIKNNPELRLMYAEAAKETGNIRDAYNQYLWFDKHWDAMPEDGPDYNDFLDIIRTLAFTTGDCQKAFALYERSFVNSSQPDDLLRTLSAYRTIFIDMITNLYSSVSITTKKTDYIEDINIDEIAYIETLRLSSRSQIQGNTYPTPLISFPYHYFNPKDLKVYSLERISKQEFLEIVQNPSQYPRSEVSLIEKLHQGYNGAIYERLIQLEKEVGLKFLGQAYKILLGQLYSHDSDSFRSYLAKLQKTSEFLYFEYQVIGQEAEVFGQAPDINSYHDPDYSNTYESTINFKSTSVTSKNKQITEIALPLKEHGKRVGYIRFGIDI